MTDLEIFENLNNIFQVIMHTNIDIKNVNPKELFLTDIGINSIGLVYLAIAIEETFKIDMSDVTFNSFKNVEDVILYIKGKI